ncbi:MAG TPA: hypothetical protein VEI97_11405, partial [bacterium]|nr:hypothetical protein [bacterium]
MVTTAVVVPSGAADSPVVNEGKVAAFGCYKGRPIPYDPNPQGDYFVHCNPSPGLIGGDKVAAVAAGGDRTRQPPSPGQSAEVYVGGHSLLRLTDNSLWALGANANGQLGDATTTARSLPVKVQGLGPVSAMAGGAAHSLAVSGGEVWAWGRNTCGEVLGSPGNTSQLSPAKVNLSATAEEVAGGGSGSGTGGIPGGFSLARLADGTVWAWGANDYGQLGSADAPLYDPFGVGRCYGSNKPVQVRFAGANVNQAKAIAAGAQHALALLSDGTVWAWGRLSPSCGLCLGLIRTFQPIQVQGLPDPAEDPPRAIAAGGSHSLILLASGKVYSMGDNSNGQAGTGAPPIVPHANDFVFNPSAAQPPVATPVSSPDRVVGKVLEGMVAIDAGAAHSLAVGADGTLWAWGGRPTPDSPTPLSTNEPAAYGQAGIPTSDVPAKVARFGPDPQDLGPAAAMAAGSSFSLVLIGEATSSPPSTTPSTTILPAVTVPTTSTTSSTTSTTSTSTTMPPVEPPVEPPPPEAVTQPCGYMLHDVCWSVLPFVPLPTRPGAPDDPGDPAEPGGPGLPGAPGGPAGPGPGGVFVTGRMTLWEVGMGPNQAGAASVVHQAVAYVTGNEPAPRILLVASHDCAGLGDPDLPGHSEDVDGTS